MSYKIATQILKKVPNIYKNFFKSLWAK